MPSIQSLKKQLKGIRSTQKLTKAMKTVSTVKFSRLNALYGQYSGYGKRCEEVFERHRESFLEAVRLTNPSAPPAVIVMASNKGLCGSFNTEVLSFAGEELLKFDSYYLIACGKKAARYLKGKNLPPREEYVLNDVPSFRESSLLLDNVIELRSLGKISEVYVIYPQYANMLTQTPAVSRLFPASSGQEEESVLFVPDRRTVADTAAKTVFRGMFYRYVLEAALGAQAATLMTMRSAYDTATEYCAVLEGEINRKRQSAVTADVIETSAGKRFG